METEWLQDLKMPILQAMNNWTVVKSAFYINTIVSRIKTLMKNCTVHRFLKCLFCYTGAQSNLLQLNI